jgi:hypothetical protein
MQAGERESMRAAVVTGGDPVAIKEQAAIARLAMQNNPETAKVAVPHLQEV